MPEQQETCEITDLPTSHFWDLT